METAPLVSGKSAMYEMMVAEYKCALRRQCRRLKAQAVAGAVVPTLLGAQPPDAGVADAEATVPAVGLGSARQCARSYGWYRTKKSLVIQYDSNFLPQNLRGFDSKVC